MTVIRPNSISGVSSITGSGGDISIFRADGTAADLIVNNVTTGVVTATTFSGNITGATGTFTGNLGVGGVLTYEDVTNIDSVGVITARTDINVGDSIIHIGDTNTKIRFPAADTITSETGGSERLRINSSGSIQITPEGSTSNPYMLIDTSGDSVRFNAQKASGNNEFRFLTQSSGTVAEKMRIHATGAVTKPLQPSFGAYGNASWTTINSNNGSVPVLPNVSHNVGSSYNTGNGTFTCPVAGLYQVMFHTLVSTDDDSQNDNARSFDVFFQIGGSNFPRHHVKRGYQNDGDVQVTMDMTCTEIFTINTTVSLYFYANAGAQRWYGAHTYFGVTLLS